MTVARLLEIVGLSILIAVSSGAFPVLSNPVIYFWGVWLLMAIGSVFLAPDFPFGATAAFVIVGCATAFTAGAMLSAARRRSLMQRRRVTPEPVEWVIPRGWASLLASVPVAYALHQFSIISTETARVGQVNVYEFSAADVALFPRFLNAFSFPAILVLAVAASYRRRLTIPLATSVGARIASTLLTSVRSLSLWTLLLVLLALTSQMERLTRSDCWRLMRVGAMGVFAFGVLLSAGLLVRGHETRDIAEHTRIAAFGSVAAFSEYLERSDTWITGNFAGISMGGVLEILGVHTRESGVYRDQSQHLFLTSVSRFSTNQYSALRLLLDDIGIVLTLVLMGILGFWLGVLESRPAAERSPATTATIVGFRFFGLVSPVFLAPYYVSGLSMVVVAPVLARIVFRRVTQERTSHELVAAARALPVLARDPAGGMHTPRPRSHAAVRPRLQ